MNKFLYGAGVLLALSSCSNSSDQKENGPAEYITVEFINPTEKPLIATLYNNDGWVVKDTVAPLSSVVDSVESGAYSLLIKDAEGESKLYPLKTSNKISDTLNFRVEKDSASGEEKLRYRFRIRNFQDMFSGRYAFDLSLDSANRYAVSDIRFMYGNKDKKEYYKEFMKTTNQGKKFVYAVYKGSSPMIFPEKTPPVYADFPETMTTYYNTKFMFPYIFPVPPQVESKEIVNHLVKEYVILKEE